MLLSAWRFSKDQDGWIPALMVLKFQQEKADEKQTNKMILNSSKCRRKIKLDKRREPLGRVL